MSRRRLRVVPPSETREVLPPRFAGWADELFGAPIPPEREATCDDCAMVVREGGPGSFNPATKCCTFEPPLPNFLVGGILAGGDRDRAAAHGRETVRARIARGVGVTPLGLAQSRRYRVLYQATPHTDAFGRSAALRCEHYVEEGGLCGIWRFRESTCSTWFCKHERGAVAQAFWRALQDLLRSVERAVARHAVLALDVGAGALAELFPSELGLDVSLRLGAADLDGHADPQQYARAWGAWRGREEEFYREAAKIAGALAWKDVAAIGGVEVELRARLAKAAFAALAGDALPARLRVGPHRIVSEQRDSVRVTTYSRYDALELPRALVQVLHRFDGRPTRRALAHIARSDGVEIDEALVRRLVDFEILLPAGG